MTTDGLIAPHPDDGSAPDGDEIVQGLTDRTRNLLRALDRHDRLESAREFVGWLGGQAATGALDESALEVLLRALRTAGDPVNFRLLEMLGPLESVGIPEMMAATGLGRVAVSERVNDMVQVGLATREMIDGQIRATPLATGLCTLVGRLAGRAGARLAAELGAEAAGSAGNGPAGDGHTGDA